MKRFKKLNKTVKGFADGGEILDQPKLSSDDFTQPGEMIPQEGGIGNFIKYNLAHRTPEDNASMGMVGSSIRNIGNSLSPEESMAMQRALNDLKDRLSHNTPAPVNSVKSLSSETGLPINDLTGTVRPDYEKGTEEAFKQYHRKIPNTSIPNNLEEEITRTINTDKYKELKNRKK